MGMSRSPTVVCADLISSMSMSYLEAIQFALSKRATICINAGFRRQLRAYGARLAAQGPSTIMSCSES